MQSKAGAAADAAIRDRRMGEQLTLRVVARHADIWNYAGLPFMGGAATEEFTRKSRLLDTYCAEIGRDPATLARSVQLIFDPSGKSGDDAPADTRLHRGGRDTPSCWRRARWITASPTG